MKILVFAFLLLATQALAGPASNFGMLKVCGSNICGSVSGTTSTPVMLKGPSLYWSDGTGMPFYNMETVDWFVDNMQIGVIRAAMAIKWYGNNTEPVNKPGGFAGYLQDNKEGQKNLIKKVVDAAIANDIYVIVDWHSHNADAEQADAVSFFGEMAREYKDVPNIIWEIFNEPINTGAAQITSYANAVITAIRNAGSNNLVLIGSRNWSQNPSDQAGNFGTKEQAESKNVAFTFHFYAAQGGGSGHDNVMTSANSARQSGYAVFGSEFGFTEADGKGNLNNGSKWITWMDGANISSCNWSASNFEASSMFTEGTSISNLSISRFSTSGGYFKTYMDSKKWTSYIPSSHPKGNNVVKSVKDGNSITLSATDLGLDGEISDVSEPEFGTASKTANSVTYATASRGSPSDKVKFIYKITKGSVTVQSKITINITDRRPILPEKAPIAVSRKAPTDLNIISTLSVQDPTGQGTEFESVSVTPPSTGTATISAAKNVVTFTPDASQHNVASAEATLNYTVKVKNGTSNNSASVVLQLRNFAPTIRPIGGTYAPSFPNTDPVGIGMTLFSGKDADGDALSFKKFYLASQYPGRLEQVKPDSLVYYPEAGKIGKITFLAVVTDGSLDSPTGGLSITLTGSGTDIGSLTPPTSIPGVVDPPPEPPSAVYQFSNAKGMGLVAMGSGKIELYLAQSGVAKLDVYSLSGKKMGSLLSGHQNAGSKQVSLGSLNLQKGVYILRLSQGSQVKTLRVVN
ncbi:MAG: cellulase family glycosylhydrolase [Fibromonadales bacterium]|nr:cellulase family glycosylhydrolase [Fibromonadales bacterium]